MKSKSIPVKSLSLDLTNYRTVAQSKELAAIKALIAVDTDRFWALMESLLDDGVLPTENVVVLDDPKLGYVVKEGNRRTAALKMIHGHIKATHFDLPPEIADKIASLPKDWKSANDEVPCAVYQPSESQIVDRIVSLTHGKGEKAGRSNWKSIARARHGREKNGADEPGLDLLEKYLKHGSNLTGDQLEQWAGDYPLTVLDEAMSKLAPRLGFKSSRELEVAYPKSNKKNFDRLLQEIGIESLTFKKIRDLTSDFAIRYGAAPVPAVPPGGIQSVTSGSASSTANASPSASTSTASAKKVKSTKQKAVAFADPRAVKRALKSFVPRGKGREKVVALKLEIAALHPAKHPHAFCFLLRSLFEISAKAFCDDHAADPKGPKSVNSKGEDRKLAEMLRDIVNFMTKNNSDRQKLRLLHGAMTELVKANGLLSVVSMNQLVHNPRFSIREGDICSLFGNIFPLLTEMNN